MKKVLLIALGLLVAGWIAWGAAVRGARPERPELAPREARGAWHVHTTRSDGRAPIDEVVRAARDAGLQFVVIADHNVLTTGDAGYRDGVLVIEATEASTRFGHVVALGVPRALTDDEKRSDPFGAIAALGGHAIVAHPLHPKRPFGGWGLGAWSGLEVVSNDTAWYRALADRDAGRIAAAALALPWDPVRTVLTLGDDPGDELARFDAEVRARAGGPRPVLLCSADAHGYPSYRAAFGAFSMHVPVALGGEAGADTKAVVRALTDGSAACVFDGEWPASGVRLRADGGRLTLALETVAPHARGLGWLGAAGRQASVTVLKDGAVIGRSALPRVPGFPREGDRREPVVLGDLCGAPRCAPGTYRVELRLDGRPWVLTNPIAIE
jgi:hypothetical protein